MRALPSWLLASSAGLFLFACPPPVSECINGDEPSCEDAGALPPDFCNSKDEAESDSTNCHLTLTERKTDLYLSRLEDGGIDQDWYFVQLPGGLSGRSLLHVNGGYQAPQTAVNFTINVLKDDNGTLKTVMTGVDHHGAAAPKLVDLITPFGEPNAKLWVLVNDEAGGGQNRVDNRNPYSLMMEVLDNPDVNEPNDTTPTAITLAAAAGGSQGTSTGYLATDNDVDFYTFTVGGSGRQIIYLHLTEMGMHPTNPAPPFKLSYTLFDPAMVPVAEGVMDNEFLPINLATARLVGATGVYKLKVTGYKPPGSTTSVKGDLRVQYNVEVRLLPDVDMTEPNDTKATAKTLTLSPNGTQTLVGKLSYVPDEEWFKISIPARATPSTLRYGLKVAAGGGRFDPLSGTPNRQVRVMQSITTGSTPADQLNNCKNNSMICPQPEDAPAGLVSQLCASSTPPLCLWSQRNEELPRLADLKNMVGAVPVPANVASEWFVMVRDEGRGASKYADDRDWTLVIDWRDDADEGSRPTGVTQVALGGSNVVSNGELSFGYGYPHRLCNTPCVLIDPDWFMNPDAIRGVDDYDAVPSDRDLYEFNLGGATGDQSWELTWDLDHADGGTEPPAELVFDMTFCGTGNESTHCANADEKIMAFSDNSLTPWYLQQSAANGRMLFTKQNMGTFTRYSVAPVSCACISGPRAATGHFFVDVTAIYRKTNDPLRYHLTQRIAPYPGSGFTLDGGAQTCPVVDAGCGFAN